MTKYILVTGGVISGIGKGVIASSSAVLLKMHGLRVTSIKIDPYLNIDAGTLSPLDHGEVFVLDDGGEVDLDLGNYERFLDVSLTKEHNITTGKIYREVIERERRGDFAGKTVQVVPHITGAIQDWVERVAVLPVDASGYAPDVCIVELGGTVGDIESAPFIEAMRQFHNRVGPDNMALIHVSLVPVVGSVGEQKTKPTQASVCLLRGAGLSPDIIACRSTKPLDKAVKEKISMFCHVAPERVLAIHDCSSVYHVPLLMNKQGLMRIFDACLKLKPVLEARIEREGEVAVTEASRALRNKWTQLTSRLEQASRPVCIAVVGKYTELQDAYLSMKKALEHAALAATCKLHIEWVEATDLEDASAPEYAKSWERLRTASGVVAPGGFGMRGIEGKIAAARFARENRVPFLGLCLGMQAAVIEYARTFCNLPSAHSEEFAADFGVTDCASHVIVNMPEIPIDQLGGTMRLGARITAFDDSRMRKAHPSSTGSIVQALHGGLESVSERHRHRYEVNPACIETLEAAGMYFVGRDESGTRMEVVELPSNVHPYFVGTQYHPEYKTRPLKPSPPFFGLILAAIDMLESWKLAHANGAVVAPPVDKIGRYDSEFDLAMDS